MRESYFPIHIPDGAETDPLYQNILRRRQRRPPSPSTRQPWLQWRFNMGDRIDRGLQRESHNTWGFVIYRTTYDNEYDWQEFLRRIKYQIAARLDKDNAEDILERHRLTIFEDRSIFENASTAMIRAHFNLWAWYAMDREQSPAAPPQYMLNQDPFNKIMSGVPPECLPSWLQPGSQPRKRSWYGSAPRYNFCVQVDTAALASVVNAPLLRPFSDSDGWVKLIDRTWVPRALNWHYRYRKFDPEEFTFEPIEGITQSDVGWCKMRYISWVSTYAYMGFDCGGWHSVYKRPPALTDD